MKRKTCYENYFRFAAAILENGGNGHWRKLTAVSKNLVSKLFQGAWPAHAENLEGRGRPLTLPELLTFLVASYWKKN